MRPRQPARRRQMSETPRCIGKRKQAISSIRPPEIRRAAEASDATAARHKFTPQSGDLGLAPEFHCFPVYLVQRRYQRVMPDRQTITQRLRVASRHGCRTCVGRSCRMHVTAIESLLGRGDRKTIIIALRQGRRHFAPYGITNTGRRRPISWRQQGDHAV